MGRTREALVILMILVGVLLATCPGDAGDELLHVKDTASTECGSAFSPDGVVYIDPAGSIWAH